jgi:hypothetical protein
MRKKVRPMPAEQPPAMLLPLVRLKPAAPARDETGFS